MKKREKFLLAFLISFFIIMGRYVWVKTIEAMHEGKHDQTKYQWVLGDSTFGNLEVLFDENGNMTDKNLTEEAKQYFKNQRVQEKENEEQIKEYCSKHPEECKDLTEEQLIVEKAQEYLFGEYGALSHFDGYRYIATDYDITIFRIFLVTIIIYSIISLEYKNIKQYCIDNLKYLLCLGVYFILGIVLMELHNYIINPFFYKLYALENDSINYIQYILGGLFATLPIYVCILIPNIILNLIRNKINNKKKEKLSE